MVANQSPGDPVCGRVRRGRSVFRKHVASKMRIRTKHPVAFTGEEWALVRLAPALVVASATAGNSAKLPAAITQAAAGVQGLAAAIRAECRLRLFSALAADCSRPHWPKLQVLLGEDPGEQQWHEFHAAVVDEVQAAVALVARKRSSGEVARYRRLIVDLARGMAHAPDEGTPRGSGRVRASANARAFVTRVRRATSTV